MTRLLVSTCSYFHKLQLNFVLNGHILGDITFCLATLMRMFEALLASTQQHVCAYNYHVAFFFLSIQRRVTSHKSSMDLISMMWRSLIQLDKRNLCYFVTHR